MFRKVLLGFLAASGMFAAAVSPAFAEVNLQEIYRDCPEDAVARTEGYDEDGVYSFVEYTFADLTSDGTDELFVNVQYEKHGAVLYIYTADGGEASLLGSVDADVVDDGVIHTYKRGVIEHYYYKGQEDIVYHYFDKDGQYHQKELYSNYDENWQDSEGEPADLGEFLDEDRIVDTPPLADIELFYRHDEGDEDTGFIFPYSSEQYLVYSELLDLSEEELRLARNEIFARHGRLFSDKKLQDYFDSCSWYRGTIPPEEFQESVLSQCERDNVNLLMTAEDGAARGAYRYSQNEIAGMVLYFFRGRNPGENIQIDEVAPDGDYVRLRVFVVKPDHTATLGRYKVSRYTGEGYEYDYNGDWISFAGGDSYESEYILPYSDSRLVTTSELDALSKSELQLAVNEIYARRGLLFSRESNADYFNAKSWYYGDTYDQGTVEKRMSSVEKENIDRIRRYQQDNGYATKNSTEGKSKKYSEYILPDSDTVEYTRSMLSGLSRWELKLAKNEIYARHGRRFKDKDIQAHFDNCSWYYGYIDPDDFDTDVFNRAEKANIKLLKKMEKE